MLRERDLAARIERLEKLAQGLCQELKLWKRGCELLEFVERKNYLTGVQDAIAGLDAAEKALVRAVSRIRRQAAEMAARQAGSTHPFR